MTWRKAREKPLAWAKPMRRATVFTGIPAASRSSACSARTWFRQLTNPVPVASRTARSSVRRWGQGAVAPPSRRSQVAA